MPILLLLILEFELMALLAMSPCPYTDEWTDRQAEIWTDTESVHMYVCLSARPSVCLCAIGLMLIAVVVVAVLVCVLLTKNVARCRLSFVVVLLLLWHNVKETAKSRNMFSDVWNKQFYEMLVSLPLMFLQILLELLLLLTLLSLLLLLLLLLQVLLL